MVPLSLALDVFKAVGSSCVLHLRAGHSQLPSKSTSLVELVAQLQEGVGRIQNSSFKSDSSMSGLKFLGRWMGEEGGTLVLRHELALHLSEGDNLGQVSYKKGPLNERIVDFLKLLETPSYPHVLWELV